MDLVNKGSGTKNKQMYQRNTEDKTFKIEINTGGCRYMREWETILKLISEQMPSDRPKDKVVEKSVKIKSSGRLRKKRLAQMVEEF